MKLWLLLCLSVSGYLVWRLLKDGMASAPGAWRESIDVDYV